MIRTWKQSILALTVLAAISVGLAMRLAATPAAKRDIVDTAVAAGLTDTLKGKGPFTVFAPTDEAFAKLPAGTVDNLLKPENKEKLVAILTYHVVSGRITAAQVSKMTEAKTLNGKELAIRTDMGHVIINDATVIKADIECSNGVIHVIDTVLIPS